MELLAPQISSLSKRLKKCNSISTVRALGQVRKVVGLTIESSGPLASLGDMVAIKSKNSRSESVLAEVVGFKENRTLLMPADGVEGIRCGDTVAKMNEGFRIPVGPGLLGRVVDGICRPVDGKGDIEPECLWNVSRLPPDSMKRPRITKQFHTGVRAIDGGLCCGFGQRVGIFAGSGVGKSTLLGMISRRSMSDVNVIALIGERGKEVRDFIEESLGPEGLAKSVLVVVTSDRPAMQRVKGAEVAMAIAEYFRDCGKKVFLVIDSLTRYAMAQREIGLAAGEPPATRGYPPSVFGMLPKLLERAGNSEKGSITAYFTVLVEGDDLNDPIADTVRGIVDGHIVLSRHMAMQGHYPPIDILGSVSRVLNTVTTLEQLELARELREILAVYKRAEDMIAIGAYQVGSNPQIDRSINLKEALDEYLQQGINEMQAPEDTVYQLKEILQ